VLFIVLSVTNEFIIDFVLGKKLLDLQMANCLELGKIKLTCINITVDGYFIAVRSVIFINKQLFINLLIVRFFGRCNYCRITRS
ncbi:hypothetical protein, partial [Vibrio brasiliensis]